MVLNPDRSIPASPIAAELFGRLPLFLTSNHPPSPSISSNQSPRQQLLKMRLLNTTSHTLEYFLGDARPPYAILSHTWGDEEILYEDIGTDEWKRDNENRKAGAYKVLRSCIQATEDGYDYIWIDTCCIDKSSSAELSEAINSMFQWYEESDVCYAFLADVVSVDESRPHQPTRFSRSKWFTRGWTLQELIAPQRVEFFDTMWNRLGNRDQMASLLSSITRIDKTVLARATHDPACYDGSSSLLQDQGCFSCGRGLSIKHMLSSFPVATRMSWAAERETTRLEDEAYCLLGLFSVNMPLLYGEGRKAFLRLQEEILRTTSDQSIFAHDGGTNYGLNTSGLISLLAPDPDGFRDFGHIRFSDTPWEEQGEFVLANKAIGVCLPLYQVERRRWLAILDCVFGDDFASRPAIMLDSVSANEGKGKFFARLDHSVLRVIQSQDPAYAAAISNHSHYHFPPAPTYSSVPLESSTHANQTQRGASRPGGQHPTLATSASGGPFFPHSHPPGPSAGGIRRPTLPPSIRQRPHPRPRF
ncbi:heterokaryon incompatibility protein-domain-containing protein [Cercophora newfieldiana]|uniref:Heterokaryon incompatibility protein-domain-containing protein n=1 Tax=Cercophora newfieldiana TaxID=92897 RepID=A0AA39Y2A7_9PEZI|nr:heterokaryon incompatibility protein-domain-containing protein [Cercophora newfieldiana]